MQSVDAFLQDCPQERQLNVDGAEELWNSPKRSGS
jgi:hypothetical protein